MQESITISVVKLSSDNITKFFVDSNHFRVKLYILKSTELTMPNKLLLGVGNDIRGDDAIGEIVVRELESDEWDKIDCGSVPENHITLIEEDEYDIVVIVDAAKMNLEPGEIRMVPRKHLGVFTMSTHALPLSTVMDFLERKVDEVYLIGIQPKDMSLKEGMTVELQEAKDRIIKLLKSNEWKDIPKLEARK